MTTPLESDSTQMYSCINNTCVKNQCKFTADKMGYRKNGEMSNKCKHHFDLQTAVEAKRPERERDYSTADPIKLASKKVYRDAHPGKSTEYSRTYRAKKLTNVDTAVEFRANEAKKQREYQQKKKELTTSEI